MAKLDVQTLSILSQKGVDFALAVPNECGQMTYYASPEELTILVDDPEAIYAKAHGVTKFEYRDWMSDQCMAYCSATTKAGKRCRNMVVGGYQVTAKRWLELRGEYCVVHGG
jgi:hypothetical protein